jgi:hypothetical protein
MDKNKKKHRNMETKHIKTDNIFFLNTIKRIFKNRKGKY